MEINIEQLSQESGVIIKGVVTKGDTITFLDLTQEEELKVREALKTHIPIPEVPKINQLLEEIGTYIQAGKVLTLKEYQALGVKYAIK